MVVSSYRGISGAPWLQQAVDLLVISAPIVAAVAAAAILAAARGFWRRVLAVRWTDLLLGLCAGLIIRALVEVLSPTMGSLLGGFGDTSIASVAVLAIGAALVTPVVEELYFRGLVVAAVSDASAGVGRVAAAAFAVVASTVGFVILHYLAAPVAPSWVALVGPAAVSVGCGILFVITGRLGAAIAAHVVYNAIGVALLLWW